MVSQTSQLFKLIVCLPHGLDNRDSTVHIFKDSKLGSKRETKKKPFQLASIILHIIEGMDFLGLNLLETFTSSTLNKSLKFLMSMFQRSKRQNNTINYRYNRTAKTVHWDRILKFIINTLEPELYGPLLTSSLH